jgi:hypothetical protein
MDRIERLNSSFMEPSDLWGPWAELLVVLSPQLRHPMPDCETARSRIASEMCRSRGLRWLVEFHLGPTEARERYPEAYL